MIIFAIGVCVGILVDYFFERITKSDGTLRIDTSNPEKDIYKLEIDDLEMLPSKKWIILNIDSKADLSQK